MLATYIAALCVHPSLVPGERGVVLVIAPDQKQSRHYARLYRGKLSNNLQFFAPLVESRVAGSHQADKSHRHHGACHRLPHLARPNFRRGNLRRSQRFWMTENSTNPDTEILNAVRPGLATTSGPLFMISSPMPPRRTVELVQRHFGPNGDPAILVAQAPSRTMNPSLPQSVVDRAIERDPASAAAEFGAEFRTDIEAFVNIEAVRACVSSGVFERAPIPGVTYCAFVDPAGGVWCRQHDNGNRPHRPCKANRDRRCHQRTKTAIQPRASHYRICRRAATISRRQGHWRQICRWVSARAIRQVQHSCTSNPPSRAATCTSICCQ